MKKSIIFIVIIFLFNSSGMYLSAQGTGFYTLKGKQFYDPQGRPFYPLVVNYSCDVTYDHSLPSPTPNDLFITPCWGYGPAWWGYDCTDLSSCVLTQMHKDFLKIHDMGFNTVQINNVGFYKKEDATGGYINKDAVNLDLFPILPPYNSGTAQVVFNLLGAVIEEAERCSLAVILNEINNGYIVLPTNTWQTNVDDYADYLKEKGKFFANYHNLLAYDLIHEPDFYIRPLASPSKFQVCNAMSEWYDAIKSHDPNHLITFGGGITNALAWDPAVSKIDFYSPHIYANWRAEDAPPYNPQKLYDRIQGSFYYLNKTSMMPWVIGETGFSAIDDDAGYDSLGQNVPPYVGGTVTEQGYYAENSLNWVRDCDASGYGWWNFQENNWLTAYQDGFGLLRRGDIALPGNGKDASTKFIGYLTNNQAPAPVFTSCIKPANYTDPFDIEANHPGFPGTKNGYIKNIDTDEGIENAFISSVTKYFYPDPDGNPTDGYSSQYTLSDVNGFFSINPFHSSINPPSIYKIWIACVGGDVYREGFETGDLPIQLNGSDRKIKINTMHFDEYLHTLDIPFGSSNNFKGWNAVTIESNPNDINVFGQADFTAREEVNIKSEFTSKLNSEVHIFTSEVFNECVEYTDFNHARLSNNIFIKPNNGIFELNFKIANKVKFYVFPNPTNNIISIKVNIENESENNILYTISDLNGKIIYYNLLNNLENTIDLSAFSKGIYSLTVKCSSFISTKKIVVQ